ncbi:hypothetical protein HFZ78_19285 [Priestia megaterium]|uniref:Uncharacterized protein n=1 Tax=Priestia megaterium TaxID=1404 RepID=A0A6H1P4S3_PRIMG|nr:hypothetical protein [Priestia megaterium]QIZ08590.1 hypothetical protein HFZ78_19285 [Priestia megaterium]
MDTEPQFVTATVNRFLDREKARGLWTYEGRSIWRGEKITSPKQAKFVELLKSLPDDMKKRCEHCWLQKPLTDEYFFPDKRHTGGYRHVCKECDSNYAILRAKWDKENQAYRTENAKSSTVGSNKQQINKQSGAGCLVLIATAGGAIIKLVDWTFNFFT